MPRINGSPSPARVRTLENAVPTKPPKVTATAAAKVTGFSGASAFSGGIVPTGASSGPPWTPRAITACAPS
jgi:hypothetical protein